MNSGISQKQILRFENGKKVEKMDDIAVEEPLEISIQSKDSGIQKISITMRTPGNDMDLANGFLFTEGIIQEMNQIKKVFHSQTLPGVESNYITVELADDVRFDPSNMQRNFYTTSSCGVCGKGSIEAIKTVSKYSGDVHQISVSEEILFSLNYKLRNAQNAFDKTGGIHASALFDLEGNLIALREDVGRHNALDKLIGMQWMSGNLPLNQHILLLSGRASFELVQKAAMAGIRFVAAVGAPSSLAIETAESFGITLIGFLGSGRFNRYTNF
ncbi:MAG: formate dehydrogenase accessory sulfurtransferase FdhD [Bacteroidetes bacterium]|nr:formate dehydrogenase accessory sulfurtransferase FdhD [Bacteroidota bacterium]